MTLRKIPFERNALITMEDKKEQLDNFFKSELNKEQYEAVTSSDGPVLALAAAGTGKTRTLVYRVAYLVKKRGINPERILLLTFTNKAAQEMLERANNLIGTATGGWWGGTFHHLCNRILRRHSERIGYNTNYTILDREDSKRLINSCLKDRFSRNKHHLKADVIMDIYTQSINSNVSIDEVIEDKSKLHELDSETIKQVIEDYRQRKKKDNLMDFDDLLINGLELLKTFPDIRDLYGNKFLHILVDEYQDTNPLQSQLVDTLAAIHRNLLVVGDDFQSIYSWRGADFKNIMSFPERYPDARIIKLEINYRSVPEILAVANACITCNKNQFQKQLRPTRKQHRKPVIAFGPDGEWQAKFVVSVINEMLASGYKPSEIAVLYRAHFHSMELQLELTKVKLPYFVVSGPRFFEQAHIKDVMSIPRIISNPCDKTAFLRFIMLFGGIGERTAEKIWETLGGKFLINDDKYTSFVKEKLREDRNEWEKIITKISSLSHNLNNITEIGNLIDEFVRVFYDKYAVNTYEDAERRIDDIYELITYSRRFDTLDAFLSDTALMTNLDAETDPGDKKHTHSIRLSTIHQAKGLEWRAVIVLWLVEGMFPSSRSLEEGKDDEEERRLFYVAVTRAKDDLCLCVPYIREMKGGGIMFCRPSRFISEIPQDLAIIKRTRYSLY